MWLEGLGQLINPVTSFRIELATFLLVAQCLKKLRYRVHPFGNILVLILAIFEVIHRYEFLFKAFFFTCTTVQTTQLQMVKFNCINSENVSCLH
jgi:hypothetical protein